MKVYRLVFSDIDWPQLIGIFDTYEQPDKLRKQLSQEYLELHDAYEAEHLKLEAAYGEDSEEMWSVLAENHKKYYTHVLASYDPDRVRDVELNFRIDEIVVNEIINRNKWL